MPPSALALGSVLQGEFSLEEKLSGHVYRARRTRDGRELAVRVAYPRTPELAADFMALAEAASRVRHPTLASVEAFGRLEDGGCYIATELVRGQSLQQWADQIGIPPLAQVVELVRRLCIGLQAAARAGVVHDALNPRNVRVLGAAKGTGTRTPLKLLDLGVPALLFDHARDPQALRFMAPEQLDVLYRSEQPLTFRCSATMNVYSCGSLLYYLATGGPPYAGVTVSELLGSQAGGRLTPPVRINPQISPGLNAVVVRALAIDPSERFVSVSELGEALANVGGGSVSLHMRSLTPPPALLPMQAPSEMPEEPPTFKTSRALAPLIEQSLLGDRESDTPVSADGDMHEKPTLPPTAPPPTAAEPGEMRDSVSGVAPIGLFSSTPPLLDRSSSMPPEVSNGTGSAPKSTPLAAFSEPPGAGSGRHDLAAVSSNRGRRDSVPGSGRHSAPTITAAPPAFPASEAGLHQLGDTRSGLHTRAQRRSWLWVALPSAAAACLLAFFTVRSMISADTSGLPAEPVAVVQPPAAQAPVARAPVPQPTANEGNPSTGAVAAPTTAEPEAQELEPEPAEETQGASPGSSGSRREHVHRSRSSSSSRASSSAAADRSQEAQKSAHEQEVAKTDNLPPANAPAEIDTELEVTPRSKPSTTVVSETRAPSERPVASVALVPVAPKPAVPVLPLTAKVQIGTIELRHSSVPNSSVKRQVEKLLELFKSCYERSAQVAGHNGFGELIVEVEIDERGKARSPRVRGGGLSGLNGCVATAIDSKTLSDRPPDTGTMGASWKIAFTP